VVLAGGTARIVDIAEVGLGALHVHDEHAPEPGAAFVLSRLSHGPHGPTPVGVFRDVPRPAYEDDLQRQIGDALGHRGPSDLAELIRQTGTWPVG
jgi:2-oxoglutarate ferredoxin oxidoreductase subunit beta